MTLSKRRAQLKAARGDRGPVATPNPRKREGFEKNSPITSTSVHTEVRVRKSTKRYTDTNGRKPQPSGSKPVRRPHKKRKHSNGSGDDDDDEFSGFHEHTKKTEKNTDSLLMMMLNIIQMLVGAVSNLHWAMAAAAVQIAPSTARRWVTQFEERGTLRRLKGSGRESEVTPEFMEDLRAFAASLGYQATQKKLAWLMREKGYKTSSSSVGRILQREGWIHRKMRALPRLSSEHIKERLQWCKARIEEAK